MIDRDYKKNILLSIVCAIFLTINSRGVLFAGAEEDRITAAALKRLESISRREPQLDRFGKSTLSESAVLLDLGKESVPGIMKYLKRKNGDWKVRYWAVDMLGYVGNASENEALKKICGDRKERFEIRVRARESLKLIASRPPRF